MAHQQCLRGVCRGRGFDLASQLTLLLLFLTVGPGHTEMHIPEDFKKPPLITLSPKSITSFTPEDITLTCEASGFPPPTFRWEKDGVELDLSSNSRQTMLPDSGTIVLTGSSLITQHQGKYSCFAANELGTAISNEVQVIVENTPTQVKEMKVTKKVDEGDSVVLNCDPPASTAPPVIHWMDKNLRHIEQSARITQGRDGNLYFANTFASDSRNDYICHAQYISARTILPKESVSLNVSASNSVLRNRRPRMMWPSGGRSSHLALRGSTLDLECIPQGLPTPTVQWVRKDGELSESRTSKQNFDRLLHFNNITDSDDGEYQCTASNTQGTATHTYTVTVEASPHWVRQPESQLYAPGETVRLHCQAEGIPTPQITWRMNGILLSDVDPDPRRSLQADVLILQDVTFDDTAVYQCGASNKHGGILHNAYVYVIELPPQILTQDGNTYSATEGQTAVLNCKTFGSPKPKVTWDKEGSGEQMYDPRVSQMTNGSLIITNVSKEDMGLYTCSIPSANLSISAQFEVLNKTFIISQPESLRVQRGESATLSCHAQVDPKLAPPHIQWRRNGQKIYESTIDDKYTMDGPNLAISNIQPEDEGMYTCNVITLLDMAEASGSVIIVDKPDPPTNLRISDPKDQSIIVSWTPGDDHNSPVIEFVVEYSEQRFGEGEWVEAARIEVEDDSLMQAKIPLRPFGAYQFRVTAINELGKSKPSPPSDIHKTPPAAPDSNPEDVRSESTDPDTLLITWEEMDPQSFSGPGFKYKVMWRKTDEEEDEWHEKYVDAPPVQVNNAGTYIEYVIKVQAVNKLGEAPEPDPETGFSGEDLPLEAPMGVGVELLNSTAVRVKWAEVQKGSVQGRLLGYKVHLRRLGSGSGRGRRKRGRREMVGEMSRESKLTVETGPGEQKKVLGGLKPYSHYSVSVTVFNTKGEGPHSEPIPFYTPEGVPSRPASLHLDSPSETELSLHWTPPVHPNGELLGYVLQYHDLGDPKNSAMHEKDIEDPTVSHITLNLDPKSRYRFYLKARTLAGNGEAIVKEGATMLDGGPPSNISMSVGETSLNLSWVPGERHRNVGFHIRYLNKNGGGKWKHSEVLNSTQSFYQLQDLQPGSRYRLNFIFHNVTFWETDIQTAGEDKLPVKEGIATQSWFIGLISAIVALLLVLLILCIIKKTKGGKYSVKDKEEGQVDAKARPLKDEGFGEYRSLESDNEEKGTTSQQSLCLENKLGSDGSLAGFMQSVEDSLKDSPLAVQLDIPSEATANGSAAAEQQEESAASSPTKTSSAEPPANPSTPNSTTAILD